MALGQGKKSDALLAELIEQYEQGWAYNSLSSFFGFPNSLFNSPLRHKPRKCEMVRHQALTMK